MVADVPRARLPNLHFPRGGCGTYTLRIGVGRHGCPAYIVRFSLPSVVVLVVVACDTDIPALDDDDREGE